MKKICVFFFLLLLLLTPLTALAAVPQVDPSVKVHDFAGLLSDEQVAALDAQARSMSERYQVDIAIVTVYGTGGMWLRDWADDFFDYNGFGYGSAWDGLLLAVDMEERELHITTCGSAIRLFTDRKLDRLLDNVQMHLMAGNYYSGFSAFLTASRDIIAPNPVKMAGIAILSGLAAAGAVMGILVALHRRSLSSPPGAQTYLGKDSFALIHKRDSFLHTHTARSAIPKNTGGGGGGGSSTHSSSSRRSHGGGSRGF